MKRLYLMIYRYKISTRFPCNSEAFAQELLENVTDSNNRLPRIYHHTLSYRVKVTMVTQDFQLKFLMKYLHYEKYYCSAYLLLLNDEYTHAFTIVNYSSPYFFLLVT